MHRRVRLVLVAPALITLGYTATPERAPRVEVGRNALVSGPTDFHHREVHIAAAPWDPDVLIASGVETFSGDTYTNEAAYKVGKRNVVYVTTDGGTSWHPRFLRGGPRADPQVAAGKERSLIFAGLLPFARLV